MFRRKYSIDPISRVLHILCLMGQLDDQYVTLISNELSFLFVGILIFTNIRSLAHLLVSVVKSCGKLITSGISADTVILLSAQVMGAYFMATVLLMRANLPVTHRKGITTALEGIEFFTFHHVFDGTFTISSLLSTCLIYVKYLVSIKYKTS